DQFSVQVGNFFGQKIIQPRNGNLALTQNIVEQFAGDQNLIGVRSRGTLNRPFTVVKDMQAQANARFQAEIAKLQKEKAQANKQLEKTRRSLAQDIESLELRTKVMNIAGVPLLVAAVGIALALVRKQKT